MDSLLALERNYGYAHVKLLRLIQCSMYFIFIISHISRLVNADYVLHHIVATYCPMFGVSLYFKL